MTQTIVSDRAEITLPRLDDEGWARPVGEEQLREIDELMKWGPTWPTRSRSGSST